METDVTAPDLAPASGAPDRTCDRCGAFARLSRRGGLLVCDACLDRLHTALETAPVTTWNLLAGAWTLGARVGPRVALVVVGLQLPVAVIQTLLGDGFWGPATSIATALFYVVGVGLALHLSQEVVEGTRPPSLRRAAVRVLERYRHLVMVTFGVYLQTFIGLFIMVLPGLYFATSLFLARAIVVSEDPRKIDAFTESRRRTRGHRLVTLVAAVITVLPALVLLAAQILASALFRLGPDQTRLGRLLGTPGVAALAIGLHVACQVALLAPVFVAATLYAKTRLRLPYTVSRT